MHTSKKLPFFVACMAIALTGCDQLGIESLSQKNAKIDAEGKAVGGACRHAGRALEDCYSMNKKASKAAVYAGWRDMDAYMRENKLEVVPPGLNTETTAPPAELVTKDAKDGKDPKSSTAENTKETSKTGKGKDESTAETTSSSTKH